MVFNHIAGMERNGIWKKTIISKTNLHENSVTKSIKELITKNLIKEFKSARNPSKRMYILYGLEPSEDSTGGNFYKDGDLDEGLINTLGDIIVRLIEAKSWVEQQTGEVEKGTAEKGKSGKRKKPGKHATVDRHATADTHTAPENPTEPSPRFKIPLGMNSHPLVPRPPSFSQYPTAAETHRTIVELELVKDMTLEVDDVQQLIRQLVHLDQLEEMPGDGYRSVRRTSGSKASLEQLSVLLDEGDGLAPGNALGEVPCGACPVESECRVGGIVSPESCVYMDKWLELEF
jgi:DNA-directed RNA polymerase III subunit RPC6